MSLQIGIVGLAKGGKARFFNVLTKAGALEPNFRFERFKPKKGKVGVQMNA